MTEADFLRAVLARPDDDAPCLIMADWLDEQGRGERAEFIRVQCAIEAHWAATRNPTPEMHTAEWVKKETARLAALRRRERELLEAPFPGKDSNKYRWLGDAVREATIFGGCSPEEAANGLVWRRGFLHALACTAPDWLAHAGAIVAAQPIQEVTLTTWPESWGPYNTRPTAEEWLHSRWPSVKTWHLPPAEHAHDIQRLANLIDGH